MMKIEKLTQVTEFQTAYKLGEITYLPHYTKENTFVAPGGEFAKEYTREQMIANGAKAVEINLWPRCESDKKAA